ncbi:glutathione transferase zeta 1 [Salpingoeca rosetta]|uniref:Glutathione transferase zeta 1 n=1 Tax=Salpingoeca rosetta (strain ATCC 50818 / BSB-021) TaxID=946362 RepID=F2UE36_SALR5|nr:glutathione transferase zeta 1 [Salpingoeca rosetta]EGD74886.1 glutathione transferase zeta 1 [Salpingoeca rosetta]|eukprot:XP_004992531.1 glutathione transferase zeta 1 [Salpingoeca rosetta]
MEATLYSYFRSSCSWRVRIALNLKKVKYAYKAVNLLKGEQLGDDFLNVNPMGELPALEIDGHTLTQSLPIIEYLDETRPENPLLPRDDPFKRAEVRRLSQIIASGIQPVQNLRVLKKHGLEHKVEWGQWVINNGFKALERELKKTAGKYSFGDTVTMVDLCLVPQVFNAERFKVDMSQYPTIQRVAAALGELPEFEAAMPTKQPDCPEELRLDASK